MKRLLIGAPLAAVVLAGSVAIAGDAGKVVAEKTALKAGQEVRVNVDRGFVHVGESGGPEFAFEVRFGPETGLFASTPTDKDYAACTAVVDATGGLEVRSVANVKVDVKLLLPSGQTLNVELGRGKAQIASRVGQTRVKVGEGAMNFDGSSLKPGECVDAAVKMGAVHNTRDTGCKTTPVVLRVDKGSIRVK